MGNKIDIPTLYGTVKFTVPSSSQPGDKHRIKGKGVTDIQTGRKGDMYIVLDVVIPKKLTREQKVLFEKLSTTNFDDSRLKRIKEYL